MNNYDTGELAKFAALATSWWDIEGPLKTLHQINPIRINYIKEKVALPDKKVLDIGCGGGLLTEGLAKLGATVTGIDMDHAVIEAAQLHQLVSHTNIEYLCISAEALALEQAGVYDIITCLEMLEHVPLPSAILSACATLLKPGGQLFLSTLNRTTKSYLFAILGAEYVLKLLPKNTHDYAKFIKPSELANWARAVNLDIRDMKGISYHLFTKKFNLSDDISVNYLMYATKP